jgi:hypothetical protein
MTSFATVSEEECDNFLYLYAKVIEDVMGIKRVVPTPRPAHNNVTADVNQNDPFQGRVAKSPEEFEKLLETRQWVLGSANFGK